MKKVKGGWCARFRRAVALALILLLCLPQLPGRASAAGADADWKTLDNSRNTASPGRRMTNTYILEVSSGTRQGGGTADNVLYFIVHYTTKSGDKRSKVLVPAEDAISDGFDAAAAAGNRDARRETVANVFGYGTAPLNEKKALGSLATDQYMFETVEEPLSFDKIQVFGKRNEQHGNWSCQGMRIYRVDTLYGLEMYGWYSDTGFIDFDGALVADVAMPSGGVTFRWSNSAGMYDVTPSTEKAKLTMLPGTGTKVETQLNSRVVFRIDFADVAGAGFESLMGSYSASGKTRISDLKYCETAALSIRYRDIYDCIREITLPVVVNALGQIMEVLGDTYIAEFAQQGDSIAIPAVLPFFASLESTNLSLGEEKAAEAAHIVTGTVVTRSMVNTPVAGGVYTISPANDAKKLLTIDGPMRSGSAVIASALDDPYKQRWKLVDAGNGYFFIAAAASEDNYLVLDISGGQTTNGAIVNVHAKKTEGTENQLWKPVNAGDGSYAFVPALDGRLCLDVSQSTGKKVQSWTYNKTSNQHWKLTNVSSAPSVEQGVVENTAMLNDPLRSTRVKQSKTDEISYLCIAAYKDITVQVGLEGATLRTRFTGGMPINLSTATSAEGIPMAADQTAAVLMREYREGMTLIPRDRTERYLITMSTDNVPNAGTSGDLYIQFTYISIRNKELVSAEYSVRDYVRDFYGQWPGNVEDFAYYYGLRDGGTIQFMIPLQGVQEFKEVSVRVKGEDEWQFTGLSIAMVKAPDAKTGEKSYSPRLADWEEIAVTGLNNHPGGLYSHLVYSREVETVEVDGKKEAFTLGTVYEEGEDRPDPSVEGSGWQPGTLIQSGESYIFDGETQEVSKKEDVPWDQLRYYMTYDDAMQDLGFTKERCVYTVSVQVAGKTVNPGNDDCGSKNLFYFRLVFENGNSGCTLANQQIVGDAFGTGELVQFKIPTSQDYGEVIAVQVIPDSQDSNSDIYDKLQIEEISVTRDSVDAVSPTWTAKIATGVDEGWVGIDYRDQGEISSNGGAKGRSLSELATTFPITETSYSTNLLVSITTASYDTGVQFSGGVGMELNFINAEGRTDPNPIRGFDVVGAMNAYGGLAGSRTRKYMIGDQVKTEDVEYYVSDSRYQFLPGSVDSFIVTLKNVYQLTDMTLTVYSDKVTQWTIKDVNIFQLKGQGIRYLNNVGAYEYRYLKGEEPVLVATWAPDRVTTPLAVYDSVQNSAIAVIGFALDSETIRLSEDAAKWSSSITREPKSKNDTLNLILYPSTANGAANPENYEVTAAVKYTDAITRQTLQVSTGQMQRGTDAAGNTVFYSIGMNASNLDAIVGVDWSATIFRSATPTISEGVLQVIRGGVLIDSYPLTGAGNSLRTAVGTTAVSTQRLLLQVSENTKKQAIKANMNDLAVALYYRTDDPSKLEYRSKYIFLSDLYTEIRPGQLLELDYNLRNVGEITGINVVSMGKLDVAIDSAYLADQAQGGAILTNGSFRDAFVPTSTPLRMNFRGSVMPLTVEIETALDTAAASSGTEGPIRMTVGYYDTYGVSTTKTIEDIRLHTESEPDFSAGAKDTVALLIPDFGELRWIELEPWHEKTEQETQSPEEQENLASWKLYGVDVTVGLDGRGISRTVDQRIIEGEPLRIGLSDLLLMGNVSYPSATVGTATPATLTVSAGETKTAAVSSGSEVRIGIRISGSDESFAVSLQSVDPATNQLGWATIDETHGYTQKELETILAEAEASARSAQSDAEREAALAVANAAITLMQTTGRMDIMRTSNEIRFTPPRNYTGSNLIYRLTVSAEEMPEISFDLDVSVSSEKDPLPQALEAWNAVRTAGVVKVMNSGGTVEEAVSVPSGGTQQLLLPTGGRLEIVPHSLGEGGDYRASVRDLDPATGATGATSLGMTHGYTREKLDQLSAEAYGVLNDPVSTQELRTAAQEVLHAIDQINATQGSFGIYASGISFTAPRNYTGGNLYYRISVVSDSTNELLFNVDVSVRAEENPLTEALRQLETAKNNALIAKQTRAFPEEMESSGSAGGNGIPNAGDAGDTGDTGDAGDAGDAGGDH